MPLVLSLIQRAVVVVALLMLVAAITIWSLPEPYPELRGHVESLGGKLEWSRLPRGDVVVELRGANVRNADLEFLGQFPAITVLRVSESQVTDDGVRFLAMLENLRELDLASTQVGDGSARHLAVLPRLERLDLSETCITDAAIEQLRDSDSLVHLALRETRVTDTAIAQLKGFRRLRFIVLNQTDVTEPAVRSLRQGYGKVVTWHPREEMYAADMVATAPRVAESVP